jgi:hypothetical protein
MQVNYKTLDGRFSVGFDVKDSASLFEAVADFQEVFESKDNVINGIEVPLGDVQFRTRVVEDNKYFEKVYIGNDKSLWGYKLPFGQNKKGGGLFPKRYLTDEDKATNHDGGNGWRKWKKVDGPAQEGGKKEGKAPF